MIDEDNSGEIDSQECVKKLTSINGNPIFGVNLDVKDVDTFIRKVDMDNSGKISYSQFLAATLTDIHFTDSSV